MTKGRLCKLSEHIDRSIPVVRNREHRIGGFVYRYRNIRLSFQVIVS